MRPAPAPESHRRLDEAACCRRLAPAARLYFLRHVGADADDLAQEALVLLVRAIRSGAVGSVEQAGGYLYGVCKNLGRAAGRKHARRTELLDRNASIFPQVEGPSPIVDGRRLWACFNLLGAKARAILLQAFVEDRDGAQIARALGTTAVNVRVMRHRALAALRACLTEEKPT